MNLDSEILSSYLQQHLIQLITQRRQWSCWTIAESHHPWIVQLLAPCCMLGTGMLTLAATAAGDLSFRLSNTVHYCIAHYKYCCQRFQHWVLESVTTFVAAFGVAIALTHCDLNKRPGWHSCTLTLSLFAKNFLGGIKIWHRLNQTESVFCSTNVL